MLAAGRRPLPVERDATRVFECENEYGSLWASEYVTGCQWLSMCVGVRPPEKMRGTWKLRSAAGAPLVCPHSAEGAFKPLGSRCTISHNPSHPGSVTSRACMHVIDPMTWRQVR